jgi:phage terminase small subunit
MVDGSFVRTGRGVESFQPLLYRPRILYLRAESPFINILGGESHLGRNARPVDLLAHMGSKHLTKAEIQHRKDSEIKLGNPDLVKIKPPPFVKNDPTALKCWMELHRELKAAAAEGIRFVSTTDAGILGMYCKTCSEYENLLRIYQSLEAIGSDSAALEEYIKNSQEFDHQTKQQLRSIVSVNGLLRIESAVNRKMGMLLKLQDRLFLNPLSKIRNVSLPKKEQQPAGKFSRFQP